MSPTIGQTGFWVHSQARPRRGKPQLGVGWGFFFSPSRPVMPGRRLAAWQIIYRCKASYQVVKMEAPPAMNERQLTCLRCGGPLNGREGRFVLKYFFTDRFGNVKPLPKRRTKNY